MTSVSIYNHTFALQELYLVTDKCHCCFLDKLGFMWLLYAYSETVGYDSWSLVVILASQGQFFKENIAVPHIGYTLNPSTGVRRAAPPRALNHTAGHTSHLPMRTPKTFTPPAALPRPVETPTVSVTPPSVGLQAPASFPNLLLGEATGELHLPGTIPQTHTGSSITEPDSDQFKSQHGQCWLSEITHCCSVPFEVGNKVVGMEINLSCSYMKYCPWDGETDSIFTRGIYFMQGNTVISHQSETRKKNHWESL